MDIPENLMIEVTFYISDIKLTYYLPVTGPKSVMELNKYEINDDIITFSESFSWNDKITSFNYIVPNEIKLYYLVSLDEWKNAIQKGYTKVIKTLESGISGMNATEFTYDDVYDNLSGRNNDIADNIELGVNRMLKDNNISTRIDLSGYNNGSTVDFY
jgi:hypothetical protein